MASWFQCWCNQTKQFNKSKTRSRKKTGIDPADQRLTYNGKELDDATTLEENSIPHQATVDLEQDGPSEFIVNVQTPQGLIPVTVTPDDTIGTVKEQVEQQTGIPAEDQRLSYKGKELPDDTSTIADCNIEPGATLQLEPMTITVAAPDGKKYPVKVMSSDSIQDVKDRVAKESGIGADDQRLIYNGKELDDPQSTLADNGITHGSELSIEKMKINVETPDGSRIGIETWPSETIQDVKEKVKKKDRHRS